MMDLSVLLDRYSAIRRSGESVVLATLVHVEGSTYRRPGARAIITESGEVFGLLSGGCLEKDLAAHAERLRADSPVRLIEYDLRDPADIDFGLGMGCRGKLTILLERVESSDADNPLECLEQHWLSTDPVGSGCAVLLDGAHLGARVWHRVGPGLEASGVNDPELAATLARACVDAVRAEQSRTMFAGRDATLPVFVEYLPPRTSLAIFGAGPDAVPVFERATALGWRVVMWDHRERGVARAVAELRTSAAVVMTHNYHADLEILRGLAAARTSYVGLLGPRDRGEELCEALAREGIRIDPLFSPAGLDVGAETPEAIALSIVAEIHAVLHGRAGGSLRHRRGPIHARSE